MSGQCTHRRARLTSGSGVLPTAGRRPG
jgi:hypothetical protein